MINRRFQVITWMPSVDPFILDPPCLQRLHFRLLPNEYKGYTLNLNTDWRSRDGFKAWYMNAFAFTDLQRLIALDLSERCGVEIGVGRYYDKSDSLHIYGKDLNECDGFLKQAENKSLEELTWRTEQVKEIFIEARHSLAAQLDHEKKGGNKAVVEPGVDWKNFPYPTEWDR